MNDERGSFTIEGAMVFPVMLALMMTLLLLGLFYYQNVTVAYFATATAERAAFSWDNSYRDGGSGLLLEQNYDGLYRRLGGDGALASLFGLGYSSERHALRIPDQIWETDRESGLVHRKLANATDWIADGERALEGEIGLNSRGLYRYVEVEIARPLPFSIGFGVERSAGASARSYIVDPVEFIRTVDLVRYYTAKFNRSGQGAQMKEQAGDVLSQRGGESS